MEAQLNKFRNCIFLDLDGVYNSELFYKEKFDDIIYKSNKKPIHRIVTNFLRKKFKAKEISKYEYYEQNMCPKVMSLINALCEETNVDTGAQGIFRKSVLDLDLLSYALSCDRYYRLDAMKKNLVITCMDQVGERVPITTFEDKLLSLTPKEIGHWLSISNVYTSNSDKGIVI